MSEPQPNDVQDRNEAPPALWRVLLAPWLYVGSPSKAAACMARASWPAAAVAYLLPVLALAATILFLLAWDATVERDWQEVRRQWVIHELSASAVWHEWHKHGACWVDVLILSIVLLLPVLTAFVAWLLLPSVHRSGSVWQSYARAFRGVCAGAGLLALLTLLIGAATVVQLNAHDRGWLHDDITGPPTIVATLGSVVLLVFWLTRGVGSLAGKTLPVELHPCCEGCGYDLTHRPTSGRCPECDLSVESSLAPGVRRSGCRWEKEESDPTTWLSTSWSVLFSPSRFYGALKLQTPLDKCKSFAGWHYALIGIGAAAWIGIVASLHPEVRVVCFLPFATMLLVLIAAWGVHRLIGALATSWWVMKGTLPDVGWARKVIAYESAYLWTLCLHNGLWVCALALKGRWLSNWSATAIGSRFRPFGMWPEELAILLGNAVLLLLWLWRYHLAARAIRWSNY